MCRELLCVPRVGWVVLYVKYYDIVASGVQSCSVVINDIKTYLCLILFGHLCNTSHRFVFGFLLFQYLPSIWHTQF